MVERGFRKSSWPILIEIAISVLGRRPSEATAKTVLKPCNHTAEKSARGSVRSRRNRELIDGPEYRVHKANLQRVRIATIPRAKVMKKASETVYRIKKRSNGGTVTAFDIRRMFEEQKGRCLCGADLSVEPKHIDHKTPISRGGTSDPDNLQFLCAPCNLSKGAKTMDEWSPPRVHPV